MQRPVNTKETTNEWLRWLKFEVMRKISILGFCELADVITPRLSSVLDKRLVSFLLAWPVFLEIAGDNGSAVSTWGKGSSSNSQEVIRAVDKEAETGSLVADGSQLGRQWWESRHMMVKREINSVMKRLSNVLCVEVTFLDLQFLFPIKCYIPNEALLFLQNVDPLNLYQAFLSTISPKSLAVAPHDYRLYPAFRGHLPSLHRTFPFAR